MESDETDDHSFSDYKRILNPQVERRSSMRPHERPDMYVSDSQRNTQLTAPSKKETQSSVILFCTAHLGALTNCEGVCLSVTTAGPITSSQYLNAQSDQERTKLHLSLHDRLD